jgi:antitoxin HicB
MSIKYPMSLTPLSEEDGGGWLITIPLLPGYQTDDETPSDALEHLEDAKELWLRGVINTMIPSPNRNLY